MANVSECEVAVAHEDGHPTVACALEKALQTAGEGKNVELLLFGIEATMMGVLLAYAIMVLTRLHVGILAIALY